MTKTYKANTNVSINIVLPNKKNMHIAFTPQSDGSSIFVTDNAEIQNAIEHHYKYGVTFRLRKVAGQVPKFKTPASASAQATSDVEVTEATAEALEDGETSCTGTSLEKVKISDTSAAKDYLAERFGVSRTAMRSIKAIIEQATAHGIEFEGLS